MKIRALPGFLLGLLLASGAPAAAPALSGAKGAAEKEIKKEEPATIEGQSIPRGDRFLGLQIKDGNFKLTFYDAGKKPIPPDVARAALRWDTKTKFGPDRVLLTPGGDAHSLTSERVIRPPYFFKLTLVLLGDNAAADEVGGEVHVIDFRQ
ncbi:MAG: hypothetical protein RIQ93_2306 [Verrucomicrobiota bacterium]|jgi:hypothetical protein